MTAKLLLTATLILGALFSSLDVHAQELGQVEMLPAERLITDFNRNEAGRLAMRPVLPGERAQSAASCNTTCDAFTPRHPVVTIAWEGQVSPALPGEVLRLDIAGTPAGFNEGNYGTIQLVNVPQFETAVIDPASPLPIAPGQVLLNQVRDNRIVERRPDLPIFSSPDIMAQMMPQLDPALRSVIEQDKLSGALTQVRVLGQTSTPLDGASKQLVTMVGLQPGMTYRVRLVGENDVAAQTVFQRICRVPVCPADFVNR